MVKKLIKEELKNKKIKEMDNDYQAIACAWYGFDENDTVEKFEKWYQEHTQKQI